MIQGEKLLFYQLFLHYYSGALLKLSSEDWRKLAQYLEEGNVPFSDEGNAALNNLSDLDDETLNTFEFDFNRLFVGPNLLLASPFESTYRNNEGTVLQQDTMKVRNFYYYAGLQLASEGQFPDDHIQYELEFICYLLTASDNNELMELYKLFLKKHLLTWYEKHCENVVKNSQNHIPLAMANLLRDFLDHEQFLLEGEG